MFLRNKKSYSAIGVIAIVFLAGILFFENNSKIPDAQAAPGDIPLMGFAWSENIGWISFNSNNCNTDGDAIYEGSGETGAPVPFPADCPTSGPVAAYGVNLKADNTLSDYAWSNNVGWIKFNPVGPYPVCPPATCPVNPNYSAKYDSVSKKITGWARACASTVNGDCNSASRTDGWDGWILLGPVDKGTGDKGVWIDNSLSPNEFTGFAWGSDVVGWLSFNCLNTGVCATSNYKVYLSGPLNNAPTVTADSVTQPDYCDLSATATSFKPTFNWTFDDIADGGTQSAYQIQVFSDASFTTKIHDSLKIDSVLSRAYTPSAILLPFSYNTPYYWQIMVWDNIDAGSGWVRYNDALDLDGDGFADSFTTPVHAYPSVDFSPPDPSSFIVNSSVDFTNDSECYDNLNNPIACASYFWYFCGPATTPPALINQGNCTVASGKRTSTLPNPSHVYDIAGYYDVILNVADSTLPVPFVCSNDSGSKVLGATRPKWKEVVPR